MTKKRERKLFQTSVYFTKKLRAQLKLAATDFMTELCERELKRLMRQEKFAVLSTVNDEGVADEKSKHEENK
jgi:predicted pyridoxine 5'-phosphate oxidase superfamily flavin-nucleotide-binding protein